MKGACGGGTPGPGNYRPLLGRAGAGDTAPGLCPAEAHKGDRDGTAWNPPSWPRILWDQSQGGRCSLCICCQV